MNWRNLLDTARQIAGHTEPQPRGRPRQEHLKTAVNRAYHAMFHALCQNNADALVGRSTDETTRLAWTRTYRSPGPPPSEEQADAGPGRNSEPITELRRNIRCTAETETRGGLRPSQLVRKK